MTTKEQVLYLFLKEQGVEKDIKNIKETKYGDVEVEYKNGAIEEYTVYDEKERLEEIKKMLYNRIDEGIIDLKNATIKIHKNSFWTVECRIDLYDDEVALHLSSYDGVENEIEYEGKIYYIYRQS